MEENFMGSFNEKFQNMPIRKKLILSHGCIIVSTFLLIAVLLVGMKNIESKVEGLFNGPTTNTFYIGDIRYGLTDIQRALNYVLAEGEENLANTLLDAEKVIEEDVQLMLNAYNVLKENLLTQDEKRILDEIYELLTETTTYREKVFELLELGEFEEAHAYNLKNYKPTIDEIKVLADELDQEIYAVGEEYCKSATSSALVMILVGVAALIFITTTAIYLMMKATKNLSVPIADLTEVAKHMYEGDLSAAQLLKYESDDELGVLTETMRGTMHTLSDYVKEISELLHQIAEGDLTKDFKQITNFRGDFATIKESFVFILQRFNRTLSQIHTTSEQVDSGSDEIAKAATDLSSGTTEQASAIEELTATIESVASMAESSAKQTREASKTIQNSVKKAEEERGQMAQLQQEMTHIKEISNEIEKIITAIEDIASQTSLLSLNASIEAARAGDAGRGFAVVADQIGKLATDSAQAAVNTKDLIEKTIQEIDKGNKITVSTAEAFEKIIQDMRSFADLTNVLTESADGQAHSLVQIQQGVEQISAVTQENAAASEESSAISEQLAGKAAELDVLVKRFKLFE